MLPFDRAVDELQVFNRELRSGPYTLSFVVSGDPIAHTVELQIR